MGSSSKKKKDKKKDFVKTKLKVGKAKAKPSNATSTSFQSKAIVVTQQSLRTHAPSATSQIQHTISQLTHHSASTRKDALSHMANVLAACPTSDSLPVSFSVLLPALARVILDSSPGVRTQLESILDDLTRPKDIRRNVIVPATALKMFAERFLLYIHSAMTHISADIRVDSTKFLGWLVDVIGVDAVRGPRGWGKTLKCWVALMGWESQGSNKNGQFSKGTSTVVFSHTGKNNAKVLQHLTSLSEFLKVGLLEEEDEEESAAAMGADVNLLRPHPHTTLHLMPRTSNIYAHLSLFGTPSKPDGRGGDDIEGAAEDVGSRRRVFGKMFQADIMAGLQGKQKEGGEVGRRAGALVKIVNKAMKDADADSV